MLERVAFQVLAVGLAVFAAAIVGCVGYLAGYLSGSDSHRPVAEDDLGEVSEGWQRQRRREEAREPIGT